ncbi:MAG: Uma2 family endonuclease [Chloroflexota bacterium]
MISPSIMDLAALLADDPTFDEDDDRAQGAPPNQHHRNVIDSLYYVLRDRLAGPNMFMAAELRVYRDLQAVAARQYREPDLLVAVGRPDYERLIYLLSEEGQAPDFVLEVLSDSTKDKDAQEKRRWYQGIGVREYIIADPDGQYAGERRLQRWLLQAGDTQAMTVPPVVGLEGEVIASTVLPYGLVSRDGWIRLVEPLTGEELPLLREELAQGRAEAALRREAQAQAREELERRLTVQARQQEAEARQREAEARAAAEAAARLVAEQEITRLRQELQRLRNTDER